MVDWDGSGSDAGADTIEVSEISTVTAEDAYDADPDAQNYAAGLDPDIAYRNQGRADSPNGWGSSANADASQENSGYVEEDYADGTGEHEES